MSQARELRRQLTRKEEDLVTTFRKREMQLEEELHRVKGQVADRSRTGLGGAVLGGGGSFFFVIGVCQLGWGTEGNSPAGSSSLRDLAAV